MKRRVFIRNGLAAGTALSVLPFSSFTPAGKILKVSLAQWSLHRAFQEGKLDPEDFASIARDGYQIDAVEFVNGFYREKAKDSGFWAKMKEHSDKAGVKNLVIMVDDEGDLGTAGKTERLKAVENHYKWVDAAAELGCHSVRVNAFGDPDREIFKKALTDGMSRLASYAAKAGLNIIIENHGLFSSDAALIAEIIRDVNMDNFGSFPDFGNWCLSAKWGSTQFACDRIYDRYQGVAELLPYARAVSAKSYNFNEKGEDRIIDYYRMLKIVKESEYDGYIGIEYEGTEIGEHEGILATHALMQKAWAAV